MIAKPGSQRHLVLRVFHDGPATTADVVAETGLPRNACAAILGQLYAAGKLLRIGIVHGTSTSGHRSSGSYLYEVNPLD